MSEKIMLTNASLKCRVHQDEEVGLWVCDCAADKRSGALEQKLQERDAIILKCENYLLDIKVSVNNPENVIQKIAQEALDSIRSMKP